MFHPMKAWVDRCCVSKSNVIKYIYFSSIFKICLKFSNSRLADKEGNGMVDEKEKGKGKKKNDTEDEEGADGE